MREWKPIVTAGMFTLLLVISSFILTDTTRAVPKYYSHDPIAIQGNDSFTVANGVTRGVGTETDPYVIEDLSINATTVTGIKIVNTDAHVLVRNIEIYATVTDLLLGVAPGPGIYLLCVANCRLENVRISSKSVGVQLEACSHDEMTLTNVSGHGNGIELAHCHDIKIFANEIAYEPYSYESAPRYGYGQGIHARNTSDVSVTGNVFSKNYQAVSLEHCTNVTLAGNQVSGPDEYYRHWDPNVVYFDLKYFRGIGLSFSNNSTMTGNEISDCWSGIETYLSENSTLTGNCISPYNVWGVDLYRCTSVNITGNNISENHYGINLCRATNCTVYRNNIINNSRQQSCDTNGTGNLWDNGPTLGGNYWSDYGGIDENSDGMGDSPYVFEGGQDNFPLMKPYIWWSAPNQNERIPFSMILVAAIMLVAVASGAFIFFRHRRAQSRMRSQ